MTNRSYGSAVTSRRHLWKAFWSVQDADAGSLDPISCNDLSCDTDFQYLYGPNFHGGGELHCISCNRSSKRAVISLRSDTGQTSRHVLPYDRLLNATVVHIDHKENNLYVRPDIFQEKALVLESRLRCISFESLEPLGSRNVRIGQVYLVFSSTTKSFARAVCGHMKYTHQNITRFQMYFVDDGRVEFIEQKDVFLLPFALGMIPPVCVPLDLANCSKSLAFSTCVDHFRSLQIGSRIVFALKSRVLGTDSESTHINNENENFPLTFTSKIYVGDTVRFEITCPKKIQADSEYAGFNYDIMHDQWSSFPAFPSLARQKILPCDVTVRVARRCDRESIYWMIDERILKFVEEILTQPTNFLSVDDTLLKFYPCIAYVKIDNDANHPSYCRALLRSFNADCRRCNVFLVDYAKFVTCDVFSLFTLEGQPQTVYETPGAAFLSVVQNRDSNGVVQQSRAYLCEGVTYSITLLSVDSEGIFCSSIFFPTVEDMLDDVKNRNVLSTQNAAVSVTPVISYCNGGQVAEVTSQCSAPKTHEEVKGLKEEEDLIDVKAALLKLEDKVTKYYDDLYRKLELLNMHDRELARNLPMQRTGSFCGRMKSNLLRPKFLSRIDKAVETSTSSNRHCGSEGYVIQRNPYGEVLDELRDAEAGLLKQHQAMAAQLRNISKERNRRPPISRKHELTQIESSAKVSKGKALVVEDFRRSEGSSSSADSGIDHSDEHSPSPRAISPFTETSTLNYKPLFDHTAVLSGGQYWVKRSDDDYLCLHWPLFFVHILSEENISLLEQHLDSIKASIHLEPSEMKVGALCIAFCSKYKAKFRAVISAVKSDTFKVFYVDYGNYEWVKPSNLYSIEHQNHEVRNHPGMAIPCILSSFDVGNFSYEENHKIREGFKRSVASEDDVFRLRFVAQRADGVYVVEKSDM